MITFAYQGTPVSLWNDQEMRLMEMGRSFIAVEDGMVNVEDLCRLPPTGGIVRCRGNPHEVIRVVQMDGPVGCVAGWISEDER